RGRLLGRLGGLSRLLLLLRRILLFRAFANDGRTAGLRNQNRQSKRRDHEDDCRRCCRFAQNRAGAACAECSLCAATAEGSGPVGALPLLEKHDENQKNANDNVKDGQQSDHMYLTMVANDAGSRLAPPTSAPSMSSFFIRAEILSGFTLPPYRMRSASPASAL